MGEKTYAGAITPMAMAFAAVWTVLVLASLAFNLKEHDKTNRELATIQARTAYYKDLAYRGWNVRYGGVYIKVKEGIQPNPYLNTHPARDIKTSTGEDLTLVNAAYMNRLVYEYERQNFGIISHITSLNPLRKLNAPDLWEARALQSIEGGSKEVVEVSEIDDKAHLRLMRPFYVDADCLVCHAAQGYNLGDVRGGLSISVPMQPILAATASQRTKLWSVHIIVLAVGLGLIYLREHSNAERTEVLNLRRLEAERAERAARAASEAKTRFLANMSHEIRTPMNSIIGMNELALEASSNKEQKEYLEVVREASSSLMKILDNVLDLSKIENDMLVIEHVEFDLKETVRSVLDMFRVTAMSKGISLECRLEDSVQRYVVGDPTRLRQVLTNLVGNALKFTDQGKVVITVRNHVGHIEGHQLGILFAVMDTGIGIAEDHRVRIFDSFTQADDSMTRRFGGTGLGLTICKRLVELMGGRLWVESQPGEGSTFLFYAGFGLGRTLHDEESSEAGEAAKPGNVVSLRPIKILLVEDDLFNQKLLSKILEKGGYKFKIASNGVDAIEILKKELFDMVFMDVQMPGLDGCDTVKRIRDRATGTLDPAVPVVALTAHAMKADMERCKQSGMDDYITKPVTKKTLLQAIERHTRSQDIKVAFN